MSASTDAMDEFDRITELEAINAELLAALKLIADLPLSGINPAILNTARAAIAKAEGKEP